MAVKIDDFSKLKYIDYGKVFLVLYFKKFTWKKELQKEFNIPTEIITNSIKILKEWDLVAEVDFDAISLENQENIWNMNSSFYDLLSKKPKIYKTTQNYNEGQGYYLFENLKEKAKTNENLANFINLILSKTKSKPDLDPELEKILKNAQEKFEVKIDREDIEYFKVFLVLFMKGFSWKKELQNDFNISSSVINKAIELLERRGFIITKDFWSLDLDSQECIRRLNGAYSYLIKTHPKIYTLSIEGTQYGKNVVGNYKQEAKNNSSLRATIEFITEKVRAYQLLKNRFEKEENSLLPRKRVDFDTGIIFETDTKKKMEFEKELKIASLNLKKEVLESKKQNLLSDKQKNELMVLTSKNPLEIVETEKKQDFDSRNKVIYNSSLLNSIERREVEKILGETDNIEAKIGLNEEEVEAEHFEKVKELKKILGLGTESKNLQQLREDEALCNTIIKQIKSKGWMDVLSVQRACGNDRTFNIFQKMAKDNNITDNGEDFIYEK